MKLSFKKKSNGNLTLEVYAQDKTGNIELSLSVPVFRGQWVWIYVRLSSSG